MQRMSALLNLVLRMLMFRMSALLNLMLRMLMFRLHILRTSRRLFKLSIHPLITLTPHH